jgi:hypothetical protein
VLSGVDNTIAQSTGVAAPLLTGWLLDRAGCGRGAVLALSTASPASSAECAAAWHLVFGLSAAILVGGVAAFAGLVRLPPRDRSPQELHRCLYGAEEMFTIVGPYLPMKNISGARVADASEPNLRAQVRLDGRYRAMRAEGLAARGGGGSVAS